jgi:hypothetical protein
MNSSSRSIQTPSGQDARVRPQLGIFQPANLGNFRVTLTLETFSLVELTQAVEEALELGTIGFDAVKHLLLCLIERRPPRLDMENYPHLPPAQVRATQAADYMSLLAMPLNTGASA